MSSQDQHSAERASFEVRDASTASDANLSYWATFKVYKKTVFYIGACAVAPIMFGFDMVIVGLVTAMPAFQFVLHALLSLFLILTPGQNHVWRSVWRTDHPPCYLAWPVECSGAGRYHAWCSRNSFHDRSLWSTHWLHCGWLHCHSGYVIASNVLCS